MTCNEEDHLWSYIHREQDLTLFECVTCGQQKVEWF